MTTHGKRGLRFPTLFEASVLSLVPRSYRAALADPNWRTAMEEEYSALLDNKTCDLVPRPPTLSLANGFLNTSSLPMVLLSATKHVGFFAASPSVQALTYLRLSVPLLNLLLSGQSCHWLYLMVGPFIN
jgi:hypothetical protein